MRVARGGGHTYGLDANGALGRVDGDVAATITVPLALDFAVAKSKAGVVAAFVARWKAADPTRLALEITRYTSPDDGLTFDSGSALAVLEDTSARAGTDETVSLAFGPDGLLYVAVGDAGPTSAALTTLFGKVLRVDVSSGAAAIPAGNPLTAAEGRAEIWSVGVHRPRGLDVDPETGDVWLTDTSSGGDATLVHRIVRGSTDELVPVMTISAPEKRAAFSGGHVHRGEGLPALVGKYLYSVRNAAIVAIDRFGPSGTAQSTLLALGAEGPLGRTDGGDVVVATSSSGLARIVDGAPPPATPTTLLATKCFDLAEPGGLPRASIPYEVTTPLWSDGAAKERFVVVPNGAKVTARADGDLVFPVGTIAVKTFVVDGKRVETRLLVQHDLEDWVGYSYAWNEAGTDAELVIGNRVTSLPAGKSWYFPSAADCTACHTPAAGYTLGLEAKQLRGHGDALARLEERAALPVPNRGAELVPVGAPASAEARARSYLHANCSSCHREGSATGTVVDLDLRVDTELAKTGLCKEAQAGTLGLATGARIVAPRDPAGSVLVARMRTLDERRMPKLGSGVVDEPGVAAVEAWIRDLESCP